ncbi:response regulator [Cryobacterium ruanii]|uniref:Response regulator n=1 Tax=Cryobacterium ruanii TaxID=1259197 RepID=A0A4R9AQ53_9MICO|nr:response regulator [Cryobacterium ruanii]TFD67903.1 response regulator [Cryobacterium ruanii]
MKASSGSGPQRSLNPKDETGDAIEEPFLQELIAESDYESKLGLSGLGDGVAVPPAPGGRSTALVVEDDHKSAKLVRLLLEAEGFEVVVASTGEEALDLARRVPLSLITLDVKLPGINGWKFLLRLHDSPEMAAIPVVVIAGDTDMSVALSRGAAAVLEKPLKRAKLQDSLSLLGLLPDRSHARYILVDDEDQETIEQVTSYLEKSADHVESAEIVDAAITDALPLMPDLILIDLPMEELGGFKIVGTLQEHVTTQHIPVLVTSSEQLTNEEQDTIDSDPEQPVVAMNTRDLNREVLLADIEPALD